MVTIEKPWYSVGISPKQDDIIASRNIYLFIETLVNNIMAMDSKSTGILVPNPEDANYGMEITLHLKTSPFWLP